MLEGWGIWRIKNNPRMKAERGDSVQKGLLQNHLLPRLSPHPTPELPIHVRERGMKGQEHSEKTEKRRSTEKGPPECNYAGFLTRGTESKGRVSTCPAGEGGYPCCTCKVWNWSLTSHWPTYPPVF